MCFAVKCGLRRMREHKYLYFHRSDRVQRSFFIGKAQTSNKVQAFTVIANDCRRVQSPYENERKKGPIDKDADNA